MTEGRKGNENATKPGDQVLDGRLDLRCRREDKGLWKRAQTRAGLKLGPWVVRALNRVAREELEEPEK